MSDELWVVRAGVAAKYVDEFLDGSFIALSFIDFAPDDLSQSDEAALRSRVASPADQTNAGQIISFAYRMQVGDIVVVPRLTPRHKDFLVARVVSPYQYVPDAPASGPHRRSVEWLGRFEKQALTQGAVNTLGAFLTVFRPNAVEAELRGLLTALEPLYVDAPEAETAQMPVSREVAGTSPVAVAPSARPLPKAHLDIDLDSQGRARITSRHPALVMEQTPRHVDPQKDWSGVPGRPRSPPAPIRRRAPIRL